jgi:hypothetical protein
MSIVAQSSEYEATASGFPPGLVGTIGVRVSDGRGATVFPRRTTGIIEYPENSGIYSTVLIAPAVPGQYQIVWDTGGMDVSWAVENLTVRSNTPSPYLGDDTARDSLLPIISRVRDLIDDPGGEGQAFNDAAIAEALDGRKVEARYMPLTEIPTFRPGGVTEYLQFVAPLGNWEEGAEVVNSSYVPLTPETIDLVTGRWSFLTEPRLPVMLSGFTHDLHGAAGDLLLTRATKEACAYDVSADGLNLSRSQKAEAYRQQAYGYLAKARTRHSHLVRTDDR